MRCRFVAVGVLVGLWTFDGSKMTDKIYDSSGQGNNAYTDGSTATSSMKTIGKLGQGLQLNGSDYVDAGNISAANFGPNQDFSLGFWMKTTSSPSGSTILLSKANVYSTGAGWGFYENSTSLWLKIADGSSARYEDRVFPINDGRWHFVEYSISRSGNCNRYLDGALVGATDCSALASVDLTNTKHLLFGVILTRPFLRRNR